MSLSTFIDTNKTDSGIILPDGHAKATLASGRVNTLLDSELFSLHSKVTTQGYATRKDLENLVGMIVTEPEFADQKSKEFRLELDGWWVSLKISTTTKVHYHIVVGQLDGSGCPVTSAEKVNLNEIHSEIYNHLFATLYDYKLREFKQIEYDSDAKNNTILQLIQNVSSQSEKSE